MKLFQYIYYFIRSLYFRGISNTFKLLTYEFKYEKKLGINTQGLKNLSNLTLVGNKSIQNHHYQGASYFILYNLFNKLPNNIKNEQFIDFGCGKGRAIFVAEQCGFTNLIGVDLAEELIEDANTNLNVYKLKNLKSKIFFFKNNVLDYKIPNNASIFYFFNPFGPDIMKIVIDNIIQSVKIYPRIIYCIYLNPKYKSVFEQNGFTTLFIERSKNYLEAIIYSIK